MDLALNNLQGLICHKTQTTKPNLRELIFPPSMKQELPHVSLFMRPVHKELVTF